METSNNAKLREALETIRKRLVAAYESEADFMRYSPNKPLVDLIDAALAAPPRNCDKFGSSTQARAEWYKTEVLPRVEGVVSGVEPPFVDWLFAPATEKEGGAK